MAPASAIGPPILGRANAAISGCARIASFRPASTDAAAMKFQTACAADPATPSPARAPSRAAAPAAREPWARAAPAALACWAAARRASRTRSRRCSRLSLTVVRIYLCHSNPSGLFRLPNMAVLPQAVETRNHWPPKPRGAATDPKAAAESWRTWDAETVGRSTASVADAMLWQPTHVCVTAAGQSRRRAPDRPCARRRRMMRAFSTVARAPLPC